jgi:NitT/TauT family transport system substrate-binding protein
MPFYVARERKFFREEGLEPELILMRANLAVQALLGGSIDFGTATGTAVSAIVNGADVRVVLAMSDAPSFDLIVHPSITSVQQLRGKKIGVAGIGGLTEILARQILIANQVPPEQVTFLPLGASDVTYVSLKAGVIEATCCRFRRPSRLKMRAFENSLRAATFTGSSRAGWQRREPPSQNGRSW